MYRERRERSKGNKLRVFEGIADGQASSHYHIFDLFLMTLSRVFTMTNFHCSEHEGPME